MKKKTLFFSTFTVIGIAASLVVAGLNPIALIQRGEANNDYTITLNEADVLSIVDKKATYVDRATEFSYSNVSVNDSGHVTLNRAGYITNTTPIVGGDTLTIAHEIVVPADLNEQDQYGFGDLFVVMDTHPIDNPFSYSNATVVEESDEGYTIPLDAGTKYIALASFNTCAIDSIKIVYACGDDGYMEDNSDFTLNIVGTNDIHGQTLEDKDSGYAGLEHAAKQINNLKQTYKYNLILDQGDLYQGSLDSYNSKGQIMDDYLISTGYDSTIVGNHEWDYSYEGKNDNGIVDHLGYFEDTTTSLLINNVLYNGEEVDWNITMMDKDGQPLRGCKLVERHGVKIGLIGMAGEYSSSISADLILGYTFLGKKEDITPRIQHASSKLQELGADFIVLQIHDGTSGSLLECYDESLSADGYVDLVLESHTHVRYNFVDSYGVHHIQADGYLSSMYNVTVDFTYNEEINEWEHTVNNPSFYYGSTLYSLERDPLMNEIYYWYSNRVFGYDNNRIVATSASYYNESALKNLIAQTEFEVCTEAYGDKYDIMYGGGYISVRGAKSLGSGVVTYGHVINVFPFDNDIQVCKAEWWEFKDKFIDNSSYVGYLPPSVSIIDGSYYLNDNLLENNDVVYFATNSYNTQYQVYTNHPMETYEVVENFTVDYHKYDRDIIADKLTALDSGSSSIPNAVIINSNNVEVGIGQTFVLDATVDNGNDSLFYQTDNESIAVVNGLTGVITGKQIGTCNIIVTSLVDRDVYATIEIEVVAEAVDTTNYGTLESPITVTEAIEIYNAQCTSHNMTSLQKIYVQGNVTVAPESSTSTYCSKFYISDYTGVFVSDENSLYVYSATFGTGTSSPLVGDRVILYGYLKNYNNIREMADKDKDYPYILDLERETSSIYADIDENTTINVTSGYGASSSEFAEDAANGTTISFTITSSSDMSNNFVYINGIELSPNSSGVYSFQLNGLTLINVNTTCGDGTSANPFCVGAVIFYANRLADKYYYNEPWYATGIVKTVRYTPNATYPTYDIVLTDHSGNDIYIDALYNINKENFASGDSTIQVGQKLVILGQVCRNSYFLQSGYTEWGMRECSLVSIG